MSNDRLYDIATYYRLLDEQISEQGGEITPEQEAELKAYSDGIDDKVDALRALMKEAQNSAAVFRARAELFLSEIRELTSSAMAEEARESNYKRLIVEGMQQAGVKVAGKRLPMRLQDGGRPKVEWIALPGTPIPIELQRVKIDLDKDKALEAWKAGFEYPGVKVTKTVTVRPKYNRRKDVDPDENE